MAFRKEALRQRSGHGMVFVVMLSKYTAITCFQICFRVAMYTDIKICFLLAASLIWLSQPRSGSGFWDVHAISNKTEDVGGMDFKTMEVKMPRGRGTRMLIVVAGRRTATLSGYWVDGEH